MVNTRLVTLASMVVLAAGSAASAQSLTGGNPNNGSGGIWMDVTPFTPLEITSFDIAYTGSSGTTVDVEVWIRPGSYIGNKNSSQGWTLTQTVTGTRAGSSTLSPLTLDIPIDLPEGVTTAVYLQALESGGIRYHGTNANPPQTTWQNADLELYSEHSTTSSVAFGSSIFTPRTFAGVVHYQYTAEPCYANCTVSTTEPILTVDDFTCFINEFAQAQTLPLNQQIEHYANCDGSTTEPILTVDDFTCFINAFAQGCP